MARAAKKPAKPKTPARRPTAKAVRRPPAKAAKAAPKRTAARAQTKPAAKKAAKPAPKKAAAKAKTAPKPPSKAAARPAGKPAPKPTPRVGARKAPPAPQPQPESPSRVPAKAAPAKEPPAPPPPKKPRKPEITPAQIAQVKIALEKQREEFLREAEEIDEGAFNISQSEMSGEVSFDEEYADAGSFTFEREKELSIGNNVRDLLDKVNHALAMIERGTYGICENCGDPIAKARLQALPYSTMCLRCKQQEERTR